MELKKQIEMPNKYRYETKFSVIDLNRNEIENIIKSHPAIFHEIYFTRNVNNIYFDTVDFSSYIDNIEGVRDRKKVRIRWYGDLLGECNNPILEIKNISKSFDTVACDDICFNLYSNEVLGVVGESGSGKTTISNLILKLTNPSNGKILYHGKNIFDFSKQELFNFRRKVQVVFQDPYASLNPTMNVYNIISEPWVIHSDFLEKKLFANKISELLISVGLSSDDAKKYPHQFSGGQRQRIAIARALALNP